MSKENDDRKYKFQTDWLEKINKTIHVIVTSKEYQHWIKKRTSRERDFSDIKAGKIISQLKKSKERLSRRNEILKKRRKQERKIKKEQSHE